MFQLFHVHVLMCVCVCLQFLKACEYSQKLTLLMSMGSAEAIRFFPTCRFVVHMCVCVFHLILNERASSTILRVALRLSIRLPFLSRTLAHSKTRRARSTHIANTHACTHTHTQTPKHAQPPPPHTHRHQIPSFWYM